MVSELFECAARAGILIPSRWHEVLATGDPSLLVLSELELDSLTLQELSIQIFLRFGVELSPAQIGGCGVLQDLSDILYEARREKPDSPVAAATTPVEIETEYSRVGVLAPRELNPYIRGLVGMATREILLSVSRRATRSNRAQWMRLRRELSQATATKRFLRYTKRSRRDWTRVEEMAGVHRYSRQLLQQPSPGMLVVAFAGWSGRLMMPVSMFLASLPDYVDQLVLVQPQRQGGYRSGFVGTPGPLASAMSILEDYLAKAFGSGRDGARFAVLGTSAGAIPAFIFSMLFSKPSSILLVGPQSPATGAWEADDLLSRALGQRSMSRDSNRFDSVPLRIIYGESERDLARLPDWSLFDADTVKGYPAMPHTLLFPLLRQGKLESELLGALR